jgi:hypothetical protein
MNFQVNQASNGTIMNKFAFIPVAFQNDKLFALTDDMGPSASEFMITIDSE